MLFSVASQVRGIDLGTGDLSELALGFATYGGDHMSHYGVNAGVPKTLISELIRWAADVDLPRRARRRRRRSREVLDTPISPELLRPRPGRRDPQRSEELVGPYELHDFFLYHLLRFGFGPRRIARMALHAFDEPLRARRDPALAARLPAALLRQPVQARLRAGRAEGRLRRIAVAARRLAHADRRVARGVAGRGGVDPGVAG